MASTEVAVDAPREPYLGPRPFDASDTHRALFFGRNRETEDVASLVSANGEVLLYAQSGAGKTSLLNAALIPEILRRGVAILGPGRVSGPLPSGLDPKTITNIYVFNFLRSLQPHADPATLVDAPFKKILHFPPTHVPDEEDVRDAATGTMPTVVIFDQFEELFAHNAERWTERQDFFEQLVECLKERPDLRLLFVMREEFIAEIDRYVPMLPECLMTRYRLERLRRASALECITKPLACVRGSRRRFEDGADDRLVTELLKTRVTNERGEVIDDVEGEFVEPVQLQVVCQTLWHRLPRAVETITRKHVEDFGDVSRALADFYEDGIRAALKSESARAQGITESRLRQWFGKTLITPSGTRGTVHRGQSETGGLPNDMVAELLEHRLVREEQRAGGTWYEITHDRLVEPILASNQEWLLGQGPTADTWRRLEVQAGAWVKSGKPKRSLLAGAALYQANQWSRSPAAKELHPSSDLTLFLAESRTEATRRRARRTTWLTVGVSACAIVACTLLYFAVKATRWSRSAELAALSANALETDPQRSLLIAYEAVSMSHTPQAEEALRRAIRVSHVRFILGGHTDRVWGVAVHPTKPIVATASSDKTIKLWNRDTGALLQTLSGHSAAVMDVDFAARGNLLVSASRDGSATIWDVESGQLVRKLEGHDNGVLDAVFSPDGRLVATASSDHTARIWDVESGRALRVLKGHTAPVVGISFDGDGHRLATASLDGNARVWETSTGKEIFFRPMAWRGSSRNVPLMSIAFKPGGSTVALGTLEGRVRFRESEEQVLPREHESTSDSTQPLRGLFGHGGSSLGSIAFSADGTRLATAGFDGSAKIWGIRPSRGDGSTGRREADLTLAGHGGPVYGVAFSADARWLVTGSHDHTARVWDLGTTGVLTDHTDEVSALAMSARSEVIVSGSNDGAINVRGPDGRTLRTLAHQSPVRLLAISPSGVRVASSDGKGEVRVFSLKEETPRAKVISLKDAAAGALVFLTDDQLAIGGTDGTARIWNARTSSEERSWPVGRSSIRSLVAPADGGHLAVVDDFAAITVWKSATREKIRELKGHLAAFSPDGTWLAISDGGELRLHRVSDLAQTADPLKTLKNSAVIGGLAFTPDSKQIAIAGRDDRIRLWEHQRAKMVATVPEPHERVAGMVFLAGAQLATAGASPSIRVHPLAIGDLKHQAKTRIVRPFTEDECLTHFPGWTRVLALRQPRGCPIDLWVPRYIASWRDAAN